MSDTEHEDDTEMCHNCDKFPLDKEKENYVYIKGKEPIFICFKCYKDNKEHYDEIEAEYKEEGDEEWCHLHSQAMWKDGLKCGACLKDEQRRASLRPAAIAAYKKWKDGLKCGACLKEREVKDAMNAAWDANSPAEFHKAYKTWRKMTKGETGLKKEERLSNVCGCCMEQMPPGDTWCCEGECGLLACPSCRPDDGVGECVICQQE